MPPISRAFIASLAIAVSAVVVGGALGYYIGVSDRLQVSGGLLAITGLLLVGLVAAFYGGRASGRVERPPTSLHRSWDAFRRELDRARRFERPFVLLRLPAIGGDIDHREEGDIGGLAALPMVLRSIDQVWLMDRSIYVVLPESTGEAARQLLTRLRVTIPDEETLDRAEMVEFPVDGVTTGALIANLRPVGPTEAPPVRLVPSSTPDRGPNERTG